MYLLTDIRTRSSRPVSLTEAARITGLDEDEILWALEEFGICETDEYTIMDYVDPGLTRTEPHHFAN